MATNDCGFCDQLYNCKAGIVEKDFYTFAAKMLCEIAENTGTGGLDTNVNIDEVGGVAVTIADFQESHITSNTSIEYDTGVVTAKTQRVTLATDVELPAGTNLIGSVSIDQTTPGTTNAVSVTGNVASDAADAGNPVKIGYQARTSDITAVANADRVDGIADKIGREVIAPYAIPENAVRGTTGDIVDTTSTSVIASQGGSLRTYITSITVSNLSAAVTTRVDILDGASVIWQGPAAPGGGYCITFPVPLVGTAATAVNAQCGTTAAQVRVSVAGYKGV